MSWLGLYSHHLNEPTNEFFKSFVALWTFFIMVLAIITSFWYMLDNWSIHVKQSLGAFKIAFAGIQSGGMFLSIGMKMGAIKTLHLKLQEIIDKGTVGFCYNIILNATTTQIINEFNRFFFRFFIESNNNDTAYNIYWINEQRCRKYTKIIGSYVFIHVSAFIIVLIYALGCIAIGIYDTSLWYLFLFMTFPFDSTHLVGWFSHWFLQFSMALAYAATMTSIASYFMSCCFYIDTMCEHFHLMLNSVKRNVELYNMETLQRDAVTIKSKIRKQLSYAIEFHIKIFE